MIAAIIAALATIITVSVTTSQKKKRAQNAIDQAVWENENRQLPNINNLFNNPQDSEPQLTLLMVVVVITVAVYFLIKNAPVKNGTGGEQQQ